MNWQKGGKGRFIAVYGCRDFCFCGAATFSSSHGSLEQPRLQCAEVVLTYTHVARRASFEQTRYSRGRTGQQRTPSVDAIALGACRAPVSLALDAPGIVRIEVGDADLQRAYPRTMSGRDSIGA